MIRTVPTVLVALALLFIVSCREEEPYDKYARPDWLAGKVYTQVASDPELSVFASCIEHIGYDTIIDKSGSYTVFAPENAAFDDYFAEHGYTSAEDIPEDELSRLVKYHIIQNPWSKRQLISLDVWGWIDSTDISNDEPRGYKRQTILLEDEFKFGITRDEDEHYALTDTTGSTWTRKVVKDSRKYAPIFFKDYFNIYDLDAAEDYAFYFDRPVESGNDLYFCGAKVLGDEIFAENGFVYRIDRVIEPLKNAYQILSSEHDGRTYEKFRELIYQFPELEYNEQRTFEQPGYEQGLLVDSLFELRFPDLTFNIVNEKTSAPRGSIGLPAEVTIRYHHGMIAPNDDAFETFENQYMNIPNGWGSVKNAPLNIKRIIANTHMSFNPIYATDLRKGFYNGEADLVTVNEGIISHREYGSNATFIGIDQAIVPRAFSSVAGAVYLKQGYTYSMIAIEEAGLLSALKRPGEFYSLYVESDYECRQDSSLIYDSPRERFLAFNTTGEVAIGFGVDQNSLRNLILNHIGVEQPRGIARKEFIRNMAGNYLVVNNETGEVSGTAPTTEGYNGLVRSVPDVPQQISEDADNGITYSIKDWFSFSTRSLYSTVKDISFAFDSLIERAGLVYPVIGGYKFVSDNDFYTVFVPTREALFAAGADTLKGQDLVDFVKLHFIRGDVIFTDGNRNSTYYESRREDESSTQFSTRYTRFYIDPRPDVIQIPDDSGGTYMEVPESEDTNIIIARLVNQGVYKESVSTAVVHLIDKALRFEDLDIYEY